MLHSGTLSRSMSNAPISKIGYRPHILAFLFPPFQPREGRWRTSCRGTSSARDSHPCSLALDRMDNIFINALVRASSCSHHPQPARPLPVPTASSQHQRSRRGQVSSAIHHIRELHSLSASRTSALAVASEYSQDDYKNMVDYYRDTFDDDTPPLIQPFLGLPSVEEDNVSPARGESVQMQPEICGDEEEIAIEVLVRSLTDEDATNEVIYEKYRALPFPGVSYLPHDVRQSLFRRLSVVKRKNEQNMLRYLSIVDDMKAADLPLSTWQWSSAIAFAGRCYALVTAGEVETALRLWKEMEQEAGVQGNNVTFNILFDIAAKAGKFVLAEMILEEMRVRKLSVNRFARVGLIYYWGLRRDGNGVRRAYRELVEAGHIVDTVVLNCVITALVRAGELPAAEQVYSRMKNMYASQTGARLPSLCWKGSRELGRVLDRAAKAFENEPGKRKKLQDDQSLAPDVHTFVIFVRHHVSETGELQRVADLLNEMQFLGLPLHGRLFLELFRGFSLHGGVRYTSWTRPRLESVWASFQQVLERKVEDVYIAKWMAIWILKAFGTCCGKDRTLEIWDELKSRWDPGEEDSASIHRVLRKICGDSNNGS